MAIRFETITMKGAAIGRENPLPMFMNPERSNPLSFDYTFLRGDKKLFGYETGFRVLPYLMQDSYSRERSDMEFQTVILENDFLKAIFLVDYGARLISLYDKKAGKELLFKNPVFQPGNLAIRNSWFSGGIEWNIGRFGHSPLTCSPYFFAKITDDSNQEFLRIYEYERISRVYLSMDFHLPDDAKELSLYTRIINCNNESTPVYWWTNTAIREEKDVRIFSGSEDVIYIKPESNEVESREHVFGRGTIVDLPSLKDKDASKPQNFDFSSEYFFQTAADDRAPWEAAVYSDGTTFYERSTSLLRYRKMFCWGTHRGGRNWCDFLSEPGKGDYLEIQAGLAPTQVHGLVMPGSTTWEFTQVFGSLNLDTTKTDGDWTRCKKYTEESIERVLSADEVEIRHQNHARYADREPHEILYCGSGWGALESVRGERPKGLVFPDSTLGEEQRPWLELLKTGIFPDNEGNGAWMVDPSWRKLLEESSNKEKNIWAQIHLGVMSYECGEYEKAVVAWKKSLSIKTTAIALRNMAIAYRTIGEIDKAINYLSLAVEQEETNSFIIIEFLEILIEGERYQEAWSYYNTLSEDIKVMENIMIPAGIAANEMGEDPFLDKLFEREFIYIKEGDSRLIDLWNRYQIRKNGTTCKAPKSIDFMMV